MKCNGKEIKKDQATNAMKVCGETGKSKNSEDERRRRSPEGRKGKGKGKMRQNMV